MFCEHCGTKIDENNEKFCTTCGKPINGGVRKEIPKEISKEAPITYKPKKQRRGPTIPAMIGIVVIAGLIIWGAYSSSRNDSAVQSANTALNIVNSSDTTDATQQAIQQFKDAYNNSNNDADRITILKNLAFTYVYSGDTTNALDTFQQALRYAPQESSNYYFILGEIAQLQLQPDTAQSDLEKANQLSPNNFQINNELALFYLDIGNSWTSYDDLPKSLQYMKVAYSLQKTDPSTINLAIINYYNKNYQQTIDLLLPLNLVAHPNAALYLGYSYAREKDVKDAEIYFQKAIDLGMQVPQDVNDYMNSN